MSPGWLISVQASQSHGSCGAVGLGGKPRRPRLVRIIIARMAALRRACSAARNSSTRCSCVSPWPCWRRPRKRRTLRPAWSALLAPAGKIRMSSKSTSNHASSAGENTLPLLASRAPQGASDASTAA
eukprot:scaffold24_cov245-Pinguiococcus_pyrenoidosus.AAC.26